MLEVRLLEVCLVHVGAGARGGLLNGGHDDIGHEVLVLQHLVPVLGLERPRSGKGGVHEGLAPGWKDGVLIVLAKLGDIGTDTDEGDAGLGDEAGGLGEGSGVVLDGVDGDETAAVLGNADLDVAGGERAEVLVVVVIVGLRLGVAGSVLDAHGIKSLEVGSHDVLNLLLGFAVGSHGGDHKEGAGEIVDNHGTGGNHIGEGRVESIDGSIELLGRVLSREEGEGSATNLSIGEGLDGHADNDTIVTGATTGESPVEVRVLGARSLDETAISSDDLPFKGVVSRQTEAGAESRVTTTLSIATRDTDSRALAANDDLTLGLARSENLITLDTGTKLDGRTRVVLVIPGLEVNLLQVMGPDREGTGTGGTAKVVMAGVADDEADVVIVGKVDGGGHIGSRPDIDGVPHVVAQGAGLVLRSEGVAALVGKEWGHDRSRVNHACVGDMVS